MVDVTVTDASVAIKGLQCNQTAFDISKKEGFYEFITAIKNSYATLRNLPAVLTIIL